MLTLPAVTPPPVPSLWIGVPYLPSREMQHEFARGDHKFARGDHEFARGDHNLISAAWANGISFVDVPLHQPIILQAAQLHDLNGAGGAFDNYSLRPKQADSVFVNVKAAGEKVNKNGKFTQLNAVVNRGYQDLKKTS